MSDISDSNITCPFCKREHDHPESIVCVDCYWERRDDEPEDGALWPDSLPSIGGCDQ
jgi:hypothetical protein